MIGEIGSIRIGEDLDFKTLLMSGSQTRKLYVQKQCILEHLIHWSEAKLWACFLSFIKYL